MSNDTVGIVILNWNGVDDTVQCVDSVLKSTYQPFKIYIVDNGSRDNSVEVLRDRYEREKDVKIILSEMNLGFSGGNNIGMRQAIEEGMDYVFLLNNDTEVEPHFMGPLVEILAEDCDTGISTGKIYFYNTPKQIWFYGGRMDRDTGIGEPIGWKQYDGGQFDTPIDVDYATGCALMVRRDVIERIGYLDDDFFYLCEDVEYCFRAADAGFKTVAVPDSIIWHKVTSSLQGGEEAPIRLYFRARNQLLQVLKTKNKRHPYLCWLQLSYIYSKYLARRILKGMPPKGTVYYVWGIIDFLRGRRGNVPIVNEK